MSANVAHDLGDVVARVLTSRSLAGPDRVPLQARVQQQVAETVDVGGPTPGRGLTVDGLRLRSGLHHIAGVRHDRLDGGLHATRAWPGPG
jgi:hypothetical protein